MITNDYILTERKFLHDLATPIMIISGQLEIILKKQQDLSPEELKEKTTKCLNKVEQLSELLIKRRKFVKSIQEDLNNG